MITRLAAALTGLALVAVAFIAAGRVADTREGLIAEIVTLLGGLAGVSLLLYGLVGGARGSRPASAASQRDRAAETAKVRPVRDLVLGAGGVLLALVLVAGLAISGGVLWATMGGLLLVPMAAGSAYLCVRFARAPARDWKLELRPGGRAKES